MRKAKLPADVPATVRKFFENPPLLSSDDPKVYHDLRRAIFDEISPTSVVERLLVIDIVYHSWEIRKLRGFKAHIIEIKRADLAKFSSEPARHDDVGSAEAFQYSIGALVETEGLLASAESRRDDTLQEIELRREMLARRLRAVSDKITAPAQQLPSRRPTEY